MPIFESVSLTRRIQYYEVDPMGIAHHANYVKWMEEARLEFYKKAGFDWADMERCSGLMIPVLFQSVEYKHFLCFDDCVEIICRCDRFNGVKMNFSYVFRSQEGELLHAFGVTRHGFLDREFKPVSLRERYEEGYLALDRFVNAADK